MHVDAVVIGAGVVGLACAASLARSGRRVLVLEALETFGKETSSRNSEVIHSGIYYPTGSLKARLSVEGARALYEWCDQHDIAYSRIGKYIIATSTEEEGTLYSLLSQARANGVSDINPITGRRLRVAEPNVIATMALSSPNTGIIDSHAFMYSLLVEARGAGAEFAWRHRVVSAGLGAGAYELGVATPGGEIDKVLASVVVNCAGLDADDIAALPGIDVGSAGYRQTYVKGSYFAVREMRPVHSLIYPVPPPGLAGLGLHLTLDLSGAARIGPDVEVLDHRQRNYAVDGARRGSFFRAASRYLSGIEERHLVPHYAGIRPKLSAGQSTVRDFVIAEESSKGFPGWLNLIGIESPGLTASLAIAKYVIELIG